MKHEIPKDKLLELLCEYNDFLISEGVIETNCIGKTIEFVNSKFAVEEKPSMPVPNFGGVTKEDFEHLEVKMVHHTEVFTPSLFEIPKRPVVGIAVDCGSVNGKNPGIFEYRLVDIETKKVIINVVIPGDTTNNLAEFLAAVHGIGHNKANNLNLPVYTDSQTALSWVRKKTIKTKHVVTNSEQIKMLDDAMKYVRTLSKSEHPLMWLTPTWGQIDADYNRK